MPAGIRKASERHQFANRQLHLDIIALGKDRKPLGKLFAFPPADVGPLKIHKAAVPCNQARDDAHHGGFARTVGADQRRDLSPWQLKADGIHHGLAVIFLCKFLHAHGSYPPFCQQQIQEIDAAADSDEYADRDRVGIYVLHDKLSAHEHDHAEKGGAENQLVVPVGL